MLKNSDLAHPSRGPPNVGHGSLSPDPITQEPGSCSPTGGCSATPCLSFGAHHTLCGDSKCQRGWQLSRKRSDVGSLPVCHPHRSSAGTYWVPRFCFPLGSSRRNWMSQLSASPPGWTTDDVLKRIGQESWSLSGIVEQGKHFLVVSRTTVEGQQGAAELIFPFSSLLRFSFWGERDDIIVPTLTTPKGERTRELQIRDLSLFIDLVLEVKTGSPCRASLGRALHVLIALTGSDIWWWRAVKCCFGAQTLVPLFQNSILHSKLYFHWLEKI